MVAFNNYMYAGAVEAKTFTYVTHTPLNRLPEKTFKARESFQLQTIHTSQPATKHN